jgi:hypothetical protein
MAQKDFHLYQPMPSYRMGGSAAQNLKTEGENHPGGVMVHFYLKELTDSTDIRMEFMESDGDLIRAFATKPDKEKKEGQLPDFEKGGNRFVWDMRYAEASDFEGMILWWASMQGPQAVPGNYKVKLTVDGESQEQEFEILKDPRTTATLADMQAKFDFLMEVRDKVSETHEAIADIRRVRKQMQQVTEKVKGQEDMKDVVEKAKEIDKKMKAVEEELYQTKNQSRQDPLNYPIKLSNKLAHLNSLEGMSDFKPTKQSLSFQKEVSSQIDAQLSQWKEILEKEVPAFNELVRQKAVDAIILDKAVMPN